MPFNGGQIAAGEWRARNMTPAMLMQEDAIAVVGLELEPTSDR